MKTSKYIYSFMLAVALAFAGCSDFLDSEDNSNIAGDNFYQTELYVSGNIERGEKENTADREMRRRMQTADFHEPAVPIIIYE